MQKQHRWNIELGHILRAPGGYFRSLHEGFELLEPEVP